MYNRSQKTSVTHSAMPCVLFLCSYHILASSIFWHWTETQQHGINLSNGPGQLKQAKKLSISIVSRRPHIMTRNFGVRHISTTNIHVTLSKYNYIAFHIILYILVFQTINLSPTSSFSTMFGELGDLCK